MCSQSALKSHLRRNGMSAVDIERIGRDFVESTRAFRKGSAIRTVVDEDNDSTTFFDVWKIFIRNLAHPPRICGGIVSSFAITARVGADPSSIKRKRKPQGEARCPASS